MATKSKAQKFDATTPFYAAVGAGDQLDELVLDAADVVGGHGVAARARRQDDVIRHGSTSQVTICTTSALSSSLAGPNRGLVPRASTAAGPPVAPPVITRALT